LDQAKLIDLQEIRVQARRGLVADIAEELTEVVVIQVLNQVQTSIRRGELTGWLERVGQQRYVDINNTNEVEAIAGHLVKLTVNKVFPKIQPNLEALMRQTIDSVLNQSPAYKALQSLPGVGNLSDQITERLVSDMTQLVHSSVKAVVEDPAVAKLSSQLVQNITTNLILEARQQNTLPELQVLLADLIEEIKINYVQNFAEEDIDLVLEQTRQLQQLPQKQSGA
jgi:hypothetical protein